MARGLNRIAAKKIRAARQKLNLSQEALADQCGLHRTYIGAVERGERNITLATLEKISNALHCPPGRLISDGGRG
jgi:transcriptional regulator with XRE-family HTH domain